jgi:hypothetical protein
MSVSLPRDLVEQLRQPLLEEGRVTSGAAHLVPGDGSG